MIPTILQHRVSLVPHGHGIRIALYLIFNANRRQLKPLVDEGHHLLHRGDRAAPQPASGPLRDHQTNICEREVLDVLDLSGASAAPLARHALFGELASPVHENPCVAPATVLDVESHGPQAITLGGKIVSYLLPVFPPHAVPITIDSFALASWRAVRTRANVLQQEHTRSVLGVRDIVDERIVRRHLLLNTSRAT